ncbi:N-alpha-acetyltransferase 35, NatC auxiliary subunit [Echria macrotheca]|uniref:N-alpha-acetyltransferase 35, NatC auxiliary subunit n=1 Tax=Echria macrotheca TaxID=438768 RepID=A0AAJ0BNP2_9PEZI|nr:N-alpha-acetyltransferase 35, NatC auxiliary subunit [Echria macrotheca]
MAQEEASVSQEFTGLSIDHPVYCYGQPQPPPVTSEGVIAIDITRNFLDAAATLEPGQLVKDGYFTLFESVGAIEIMDPKMDSGCLAPDESLDEDYDVTRPLLPAEVLGIIDQLLCLEMAWHLGYPLSQTLLTNVYIEAMLVPNPTTIKEADFIRGEGPRDPMFIVLRAYCLGLLKACLHVNERIKYEHYYEEEDFVTTTYHRSLLENIDDIEIRDEIMAAKRLVHSLRPKISDEMADALSFRLELRTAFLRAIELAELRSHWESLSLPWSQMKAIWEPINRSRHLGTPVPEAFSTKLQRRLASTMPPRPIVQPSFEETYEHFKKFFADGIDLLKILNYTDSQSLLNFVVTFQAQKPQPLVYIRTLLQWFLIQDMVVLGRVSIRQVLDDDLSIVALPCSRLLDPANDEVEAPHDTRFAIAHQMELFRQRVAPSYLDIFKALCQNRCRVRRALCHAIQDWETVQMDAEEIDQLLQVQLEEKPITYDGSTPAYSIPLSSWAYLYKVRLMEWIVQLGFELETYQPDEMAGMYWYLSYLAKTRAKHAERIKAFTVQRLNELRAHPFSNTAAMEATFTTSLSYLRATILDATSTLELADALSCLYTVLGRLRLIVPPPRPYSSDELRYEIRMKPFAPISLPRLPSYDNFVRLSAQHETSTAGLLDFAQRAVVNAKMGYDVLGKMGEKEAFTANAHERWLAGIKNCNKSGIAINIAVAAIRRALESGAAKEGGMAPGEQKVMVELPKPAKSYHEWWIVPKIVEKKS